MKLMAAVDESIPTPQVRAACTALTCGVMCGGLRVSLCAYARPCVCVCVCVRVRVRVRMRVCVCACVWLFVYACVRAYVSV